MVFAFFLSPDRLFLGVYTSLFPSMAVTCESSVGRAQTPLAPLCTYNVYAVHALSEVDGLLL
jgi:hypothetical protein